MDFYNSDSKHMGMYEELKSRREYLGTPGETRYLYEYAEDPSKIKREFSKWFKENIGELNGEFESYNFEDEPNGPTQTRVGRNNLMFDLMYARLTDYETMEDRFTPGGFESIKDARMYILGLKGLNRDTAYDYSDPYTLILYNQQNQVAGKLIGVFANQNANAAISSLIAKFELNEKISFGSKVNFGLSDLKNKKSKVRETLASAVDAVKEPCLKDLNITMTTASSACILARLGYSYEDIGLLLNQPAILEITKQAANSNTFNITNLIKEKLIELSGTEDPDKIDSSGLSVDILENNIKAAAGQIPLTEVKDYTANQIKALKLFLQVYEAASELNDFVGNTGFTRSNSVKSNFGGMYAQQMKVWKYIDNANKGDRLITIDIDGNGQVSPIIEGLNTSSADYMEKVTQNPFGYEQAQYDACKEFLQSLANYFPYEAMASIRKDALNVIKGNADESIVETLHKIATSIYVNRYMNSNGDFNPEATKEFKGEIYDNYTYYTKVVPIKIAYFMHENEQIKESNGLLRLLVEDADDNNNLIIRFRDNGALMHDEKESIIAGWKQLLKNGPDGIAMAKEIYMYNYYMSGTGFGTIGFNHLAPVEVKLLLGDGEYLPAHYNLLKETDRSLYDSMNMPSLLEEFTIACKNAYQVVYSVPKDMFDLMKTGRAKGSTAGAKENVPRIFDTAGDISTITIDPSVEAWDPFFISRAKRDEDTPNVFRAGFTIKDGDNTYLYVCDNPESFNVLPKGQAMTYKLVTEREERVLDPFKVIHNGDELDFGSYDSSLKGDDLKNENIATARRILEICNSELGLDVDIDTFIRGKFESTEDEAMHEDFTNFKAMVCKECTKRGFKGKINGEDIC